MKYLCVFMVFIVLSVLCAAESVSVLAPGNFYQGAFLGGIDGSEDRVTKENIDAYTKAANRSPAWVYFSHEWSRGRDFPKETCGIIKGAGSTPFIRLMLRTSVKRGETNHDYNLVDIFTGKFDNDLRKWARGAKEYGAPLIVEFGTEANASWFPWNGLWNGMEKGTSAFRYAYQQIVRISRMEGAANITWVFHVNSDDFPGETWNRMEKYYPGDTYVDWVGVSVYGAKKPAETPAQDFRGLMDRVYARMTESFKGKPVVLLEFGMTNNHPAVNQAEWADAVLKDILSSRWKDLIGFAWWNDAWPNDGNPKNNTNMRIQDNPDLQDVFKKNIGDNVYDLCVPVKKKE